MPIDQAIAAATEHHLPVPEGIDSIEPDIDAPTTGDEAADPYDDDDKNEDAVRRRSPQKFQVNSPSGTNLTMKGTVTSTHNK